MKAGELWRCASEFETVFYVAQAGFRLAGSMYCKTTLNIP